jgi:hypothetical protein
MISAPLAPLWHAASVRRWHQNPALAHTHQTIADHQGRCVLLLLALHPAPSLALLRAVATHDIGERVAGDSVVGFQAGGAGARGPPCRGRGRRAGRAVRARLAADRG